MIDFNKHKREMRVYAFLFELNPIIFDTNCFVDIDFDKEFLYICYNQKPSNNILEAIFNNKYYYTNITHNELLAFKFKLRSKEQLIQFDLIRTNNTLFLNKQFILEMCIYWKDYINDTFYYTID